MSARIVVAGGGMCGMAAALALADDGHAVTVIEQDPAPPPPDPDAAFGWERRSVAQFGLAHWLHARGRRILAEQLPDVHERLADNGGHRFNPVTYMLSMQPGAEATPDDDRFEVLTGRRSTLEWVAATIADEHPEVTVRRGEAIGGFTSGATLLDGVPHVTGVRLKSGEEIPADLIVDATGRRSPTPKWLADIGAEPPLENAEDSGFAYYGRYFRSGDGSVPVLMAPALTPFGTFSMLTLPADNGTWAVTLYGLAEDKLLRRLRDPEIFERVVRACPLQAHWLDGEPISDMASMSGVVDRHRRFVVDGAPCATGVLSVGDASSCTNPSLGRGITLGLMHVELLRAAVADHLDDPAELALAFDHATESTMGPWHEATTAVDRQRVTEMRALLSGEEYEPDDAAKITALLMSAAPSDAIAARTFGEIFSCFALPNDVLARPGVFEHVLGLADTVNVEPPPGPSRDELVELVG